MPEVKIDLTGGRNRQLHLIENAELRSSGLMLAEQAVAELLAKAELHSAAMSQLPTRETKRLTEFVAGSASRSKAAVVRAESGCSRWCRTAEERANQLSLLRSLQRSRLRPRKGTTPWPVSVVTHYLGVRAIPLTVHDCSGADGGQNPRAVWRGGRAGRALLGPRTRSETAEPQLTRSLLDYLSSDRHTADAVVTSVKGVRSVLRDRNCGENLFTPLAGDDYYRCDRATHVGRLSLGQSLPPGRRCASRGGSRRR